MTPADQVAQLERRAWQSTFDDGLFDLLLGSMLLLNWLGSVIPDNRLLYPFFLGLSGVYVVLKRYVVMPRAGYARFGAPRRRRKVLSMSVLLLTTLLGAAAMMLFMLNGPAAVWLRAHPIVFQSGLPLMVVMVFSALASLLDFPRAHVIGLVMGLAFGTALWFDRPIGFLLGGTAVTLVGAVFFVRFLRTHPRMSADDRTHEAGHVH